MASQKTKAPPLTKALAVLWASLVGDLFDTYRPELHYMRGPGPKWRAKHQAAAPASLAGLTQAPA